MRVYDPRLGRFLSVDPIGASFPWYTPYQFAGNKPIFAIDLDGLEDTPYDIIKAANANDQEEARLKKIDPELARQFNIRRHTIGGLVIGGFLTAGIGTAYLAGGTGVYTTVLTATTARAVSTTATGALVWANRNPQLIQEGGNFILGILNPGPEDLNPGSSSDELGKTIGKGAKALLNAATKSGILRQGGSAKLLD